MSAAYEQLTGQEPVARPVATGTTTDRMLARVGMASVAFVGICTILISAWGGIVPFVGPSFGYAAAGTGAWHWDLAQAVLALVPGAVGVVAGLSMLSSGVRLSAGTGRLSLAGAGLLAVLAGGWFVIGPFAWPVIDLGGHYFIFTTPFHDLTNRLGYAFGPGLMLAAFGAFTIGWAVRHRPLSGVRTSLSTVPASSSSETVLTPVASPAEPGQAL